MEGGKPGVRGQPGFKVSQGSARPHLRISSWQKAGADEKHTEQLPRARSCMAPCNHCVTKEYRADAGRRGRSRAAGVLLRAAMLEL